VHKTKLIAILALVIAFTASALTAAGASAATPGEPWKAAGTGTATTTLDGTGGDASMKYSVAGQSGSWTFSATAKTARKQAATWHYNGYHAWFQVRVGIEKFVVRNGKEIATEKLAGAGPVNCCAAPSGGFDYTGTTTFDLQPGDVYGFRMTGSNFDSDRRLLGTLTLSLPTPQPLSDLGAMVLLMGAQLGDIDAQIKAINSLPVKTEQDLLRLQTLIAKRNQQLELLTNAQAKYQAAQDAIIGNIR
jgi:hypothetical protein